MNWSTIENALVAAVKSASGFADGAVFLPYQDGGTHPAGSFITVAIGDMIAPDTLVPSQTRVVTSLDGDGEPVDPLLAGAEITHTFRMPRRFSASIQVFTGTTMVGTSSARAVATQIQSKLVLPAIRYALSVAGLGLIDVGDVKNIPEIKGTKFEARAVIEPTFYLLDAVTETSGYIKTVNLN